jgi:hypothetical protein
MELKDVYLLMVQNRTSSITPLTRPKVGEARFFQESKRGTGFSPKVKVGEDQAINRGILAMDRARSLMDLARSLMDLRPAGQLVVLYSGSYKWSFWICTIGGW